MASCKESCVSSEVVSDAEIESESSGMKSSESLSSAVEASMSAADIEADAEADVRDFPRSILQCSMLNSSQSPVKGAEANQTVSLKTAQTSRPVSELESTSDMDYRHFLLYFENDVLKEDNIDALVICEESDRKAAYTFKQQLEKDIVVEQEGVIYKPRVKLLDEIRGSSMDDIDFAFHKTIYVFLYVTKAFCNDAWTLLKGQACLVEAIKDERKRWCVIPVHTRSKKSMNYRLPMMLGCLKAIQYWSVDNFYNESVRKLFEQKLDLIISRDRDLEIERQRYFMENKKKILDLHNFSRTGKTKKPPVHSQSLPVLSLAVQESSMLTQSNEDPVFSQNHVKTKSEFLSEKNSPTYSGPYGQADVNYKSDAEAYVSYSSCSVCDENKAIPERFEQLSVQAQQLSLDFDLSLSGDLNIGQSRTQSVSTANMAPVSVAQSMSTANIAPVSVAQSMSTVSVAPVSVAQSVSTANIAPVLVAQSMSTVSVAPVSVAQSVCTVSIAPVSVAQSVSTDSVAPVSVSTADMLESSLQHSQPVACCTGEGMTSVSSAPLSVDGEQQPVLPSSGYYNFTPQPQGAPCSLIMQGPPAAQQSMAPSQPFGLSFFPQNPHITQHFNPPQNVPYIPNSHVPQNIPYMPSHFPQNSQNIQNSNLPQNVPYIPYPYVPQNVPYISNPNFPQNLSYIPSQHFPQNAQYMQSPHFTQNLQYTHNPQYLQSTPPNAWYFHVNTGTAVTPPFPLHAPGTANTSCQNIPPDSHSAVPTAQTSAVAQNFQTGVSNHSLSATNSTSAGTDTSQVTSASMSMSSSVLGFMGSSHSKSEQLTTEFNSQPVPQAGSFANSSSGAPSIVSGGSAGSSQNLLSSSAVSSPDTVNTGAGVNDHLQQGCEPVVVHHHYHQEKTYKVSGNNVIIGENGQIRSWSADAKQQADDSADEDSDGSINDGAESTEIPGDRRVIPSPRLPAATFFATSIPSNDGASQQPVEQGFPECADPVSATSLDARKPEESTEDWRPEEGQTRVKQVD